MVTAIETALQAEGLVEVDEAWIEDEEAERFFVGIDWGSEQHDVVVIDDHGREVTSFVVKHDVKGLIRMLERIQKVGGNRCLFGIERPDGLIVDFLQARNLPVWHCNPKQVDRFRDRFSIGGAKDDHLDARVLASSLRTDRHLYHRVEELPAELMIGRTLARRHTTLARDRVRLTNRILACLSEYYPQFVAVSIDFSLDWVRELWRLVPTHARARKVRNSAVEDLFARQRVTAKTAAEVLAMLREDDMVARDGVEKAMVADIEGLLDILDVVVNQERRVSRTLAAWLDDFEKGAAPEDSPMIAQLRLDAAVLRTVPGVGNKVLTTILTEGTQALRERNYRALRVRAGVAPVTRRTGKHGKARPLVLMRRACSGRLRDAMHHMAQTAIAQKEQNPWKDMYVEMVARLGAQRRARILRQIADRMLAMMMAMVTSGTTYDSKLIRRNSAKVA